MSYQKTVTTHNGLTTPKEKQTSTTTSQKETVAGPVDAALARSLRHAAAGDYEKALDQLTTAGKSPRAMNARGVCLLRLGRIEASIRVFREFLLTPGATWMRPDVPTVYKTNYATALLLGDHPSGCIAILNEINDGSHPSVQRLREAIRRWEGSLSFWQRLNWRFGKIDPSGRPVQLDFAPGEFDEPAAIAGAAETIASAPPRQGTA